MSTRTNLHITQKGVGWKQTVQLYRHCDGYPSSILPSIHRAFHEISDKGWEAGRAGKSASFIIAEGVSDGKGEDWDRKSTSYEPEEGLVLHGDIEWFYRITVGNSWYVEVYDRENWEPDPTVENMRLVAEGTIDELQGRIKEIGW